MAEGQSRRPRRGSTRGRKVALVFHGSSVLFRRTIALICIVSVTASPVIAANEELPDIGNPADTVLSRDKEVQIGRAIYKSLRDTGRMVTDPEIQDYIQDIGQKLAAHATDNGQKFRFFVVDDLAINAFALP